MESVTVTIGRNVGDHPLPAEEWNEYVRATRDAVERATSELWAVAPYKGEWEGTQEEAVVFFGPLLAGYEDDAYRVLGATLATLATYYRQDGIGVARGESTLVEPYGVEPVGAHA